ncbi:MAG TPA: hypothetical protein VEA99_08080, partial [Gemmatimonadaceae bacterium]|nr:hypothetical protein [Gemmatimonadaceae bacterium]
MARVACAGGLLVAGLLLAASALPAQARDTDVWLAPLARRGDTLVVGAPRNLTRRPGYDNQPSFTPDSKAVLYTAIGADGQADIFRVELATGAISRLTATPESEYSPTVTPDGRSFSVVRVERDSTQRLWRFPLAGGEPSLVLEQVKPVGYHAWVDDTTLALFVLGQPATLQIASTRGGLALPVTRGIGRGLQHVPGTRTVAFVARLGDVLMLSSYRLDSIPPRPGEERMVLLHRWTALPRQEFFAFAGSTVMSASGSDLLAWTGWGKVGGPGDPWTTVARLGGAGVREITRLSV